MLAALVRARAPEIELHEVEDAREATQRARASLGVDDALCCTGSVYLAGAALDHFDAS